MEPTHRPLVKSRPPRPPICISGAFHAQAKSVPVSAAKDTGIDYHRQRQENKLEVRRTGERVCEGEWRKQELKAYKDEPGELPNG